MSQAVAESVTDGTEGDHDVQVLPAAVDEEGKQRQGAEIRIPVTRLSYWSHSLKTQQLLLVAANLEWLLIWSSLSIQNDMIGLLNRTGVLWL